MAFQRAIYLKDQDMKSKNESATLGDISSKPNLHLKVIIYTDVIQEFLKGIDPIEKYVFLFHHL